MQPNPGFPCHGCGHCCRQLRDILQALSAGAGHPVMQAAGAAFPYAVLPSGACTQLQPDSTCAVYATRPQLCSVDAMYDALCPDGLTRADWYELNAAHCPPAIV